MISEQWAAAFIGACGEDSREGLAAFKCMAAFAKQIPGVLRGSFAAEQLDRMIETALKKSGSRTDAAEIARRTLVLMVRRNRFVSVSAFITEVEKALARMDGIITVRVESAHLLDDDFQKALKEKLLVRANASDFRYRQKKNIKKVELDLRLVPELLGGCRVYINGECFDSSLKGQLQKMARDFYVEPFAGGIL